MDVDELLDTVTIPRGDIGGSYRLRQELGPLANNVMIRSALLAVYSRGAVHTHNSIGFIGGTRYCPGCMNEFHADYGQHKPDCSVLADMRADDPDGL